MDFHPPSLHQNQEDLVTSWLLQHSGNGSSPSQRTGMLEQRPAGLPCDLVSLRGRINEKSKCRRGVVGLCWNGVAYT